MSGHYQNSFLFTLREMERDTKYFDQCYSLLWLQEEDMGAVKLCFLHPFTLLHIPLHILRI